MKIFISGGAGFIGSNLTKYLLTIKKASITIYDNFSNGDYSFVENFTRNSKFKIVQGDLLDYSKLETHIADHDFVAHLAANADISESAKNTKLDLEQTILATFNILEAMRQTGVKKLIYSAESGIYGDFGYKEPDEAHRPLFLLSPYGATW